MAGRLVRIGAPDSLADFYDSPSHIFGSGEDAVVTISTNTSLTSDMYYRDLTVDSGVTLTTAGYRVFVQRNLYLNGTLGMAAGPSTQGSLGIGTQDANVTNSLGGASTSHTVTAPIATLVINSLTTLAEVPRILLATLISSLEKRFSTRRGLRLLDLPDLRRRRNNPFPGHISPHGRINRHIHQTGLPQAADLVRGRDRHPLTQQEDVFPGSAI